MILTILLDLLAAALVLVTVLPMAASHQWWLRMWDFPRVQLAACLAALIVILLLVDGRGGWPLLLGLAACLLYQGWRIFPYTPLARVEMDLVPAGPDTITLLVANVLMENTAHDRVRALIARVDPDILLLMETDQVWIDALEGELARYDTVVRNPRDNHYGMVFATRLPVSDARTVCLTADDTPSLFAELTGPGGQPFRFVGLHPRPPVPGEDTDERDAQVLFAARFARKTAMPLVVMGDFNDVAWSHTSHRFKRVGGYLDPRVGRGLYASFDAKRWWFRCPIDQIFVTPEVAVASFGLAEAIGSDHFPLVARIMLDPEVAARANRPPRPLSDAERAGIDAAADAWGTRIGLRPDR